MGVAKPLQILGAVVRPPVSFSLRDDVVATTVRAPKGTQSVPTAVASMRATIDDARWGPLLLRNSRRRRSYGQTASGDWHVQIRRRSLSHSWQL